MKLICTQENLNQGLDIVSHITSKNTSLPILNNVLIKAEKGSINLITTNLEIGINTQIRGKIEKDGSYTLNAKLLHDYVSLLPNEKVEISLQDDSLEIKTANQETSIKGNSPEEYPLIPQVSKKAPFTCAISKLLKALSQVLFAVSISETRPEISGVYFNFKDDNLTLATTDSYRLAEKTIKLEINASEEKEIILPAKTAQELYRILSAYWSLQENASEGEADKIEIYFEDNQALFVFDNVELVSRIIEGQYPNYRQIIPVSHKTSAIINANALIKAAKTASLFSRTGIYDISLEFSKNKVIISSVNSQLGESKTSLDSQIEGEDNKITINYRYLLDGLQNIDASEAVLEMTDSGSPCVIRPVESLPEKEKPIISQEYLYIIMPIKQ